MNERALGTMPRTEKGPIEAPPALAGPSKDVADTVEAWPGVTASVHWHLYDTTRVDGVDFYVGDDELGHIHLDGFVHLATSPELGSALVADGLGRPFPYAHGWVHEQIQKVGPAAAIALFRRNYDRLWGAD